jgi:hypothetical protein
MKRALILLTFAILISVSTTYSPADSVLAQAGEGYLILNEINPWATDDNLKVELLNPTNATVSLEGWTIEFLSGFSYTFPRGSGEVTGRAIHVLNITGPNPLNPDGDGCILSDTSNPIDCLWWGQEFSERRIPLPFGSPLWPEYEVYSEEIMFQPDDVLIRKPGTWPPETTALVSSENWAYRNGDHVSFGQPNPNPGPVLFLPQNGSVNISRFPLQVMGFGASEVLFQVATNENFENIVIEDSSSTHQISTAGLPAGTYYWRVKDASRLSDPWSITVTVTYRGEEYQNLVSWVEAQSNRNSKYEQNLLAQNKRGEVDTEPMFAPAEFHVLSFHVVGGMHFLQNKDTDMVCLDGCPRDDDYNWEDPHPEEQPLTGYHNDNYCSRASLAMLAAQGGCELSEDRISYYIFEEMGDTSRSARETGHIGTPDTPDPYLDLGHGRGVWPSDAMLAMDWIYGVPSGTSIDRQGINALFNDNDPSDMDTIKEYLDAGILIYRSIPGHAQVVDGYTEFTEGESTEVRASLRIREPGTLSSDPLCVGWTESWDSIDISYLFPPSSGSPIRCDEPEVAADSDGDGLVDFDETNRFLTDPHNTDSDDDGVQDMLDMYGYLFNNDGEYEARDRDIDFDGVAKEMDPDNDQQEDDGVNDGCEDADANGFFDDNDSESDCFDFEDDFSVVNPNCFRGYIRLESTVNMSQPGIGFTTVREEVILDSETPLDGETFGHRHSWNLNGQVTVATGMPGLGSITSTSSGSGFGEASILLEVDEDGNYTITTDTDPRTGSWTISTMGRVTSETIYLGFANHHYEYVSPDAPPFVWNMFADYGKPNILTGQIETRDDGVTVARGVETWTMPALANMTGSITRTWEIVLSAEDTGG